MTRPTCTITRRGGILTCAIAKGTDVSSGIGRSTEWVSTDGRRVHRRLAALLLLGLWASSAAAQTTVSLVPVGTGPSGELAPFASINGNEITLLSDGVSSTTVFLEIRIGDWDPEGTGTKLQSFQVSIDSSGYSSGLRGVLTPAFVPCNGLCDRGVHDGAVCQADSECNTCIAGDNDGMACADDLDCPGAGATCTGDCDTTWTPDGNEGCRAAFGGFCSSFALQGAACVFSYFDCCGIIVDDCGWGFGGCEGPRCAHPTGQKGACEPAFIFSSRLDYVFVVAIPGGYIRTVDLSTLDYRYASAVVETPVVPPDPFPADGVYAGTLVLDVPPDAEGTFTIPLFPEPSTVLIDQDNAFIPIELFSAKITVIACVGPDCQPNGFPDDCDILVGNSNDCNDNAVPDECDVADGTSGDCNNKSVPDECDIDFGPSIDCNHNAVPDECDLADGTSQDCNRNGRPDECDIVRGVSLDCNGNTVPDECDIAFGPSIDCNRNKVPDECDISGGVSLDCNSNGVPDGCELGDGSADDCNGNDVPDECDIAGGPSVDCNGNAVPDECDVRDGTSRDCNVNGQPDECDIAGGVSLDCNGNEVPDSCELADDSADDCNGNEVPDGCELADGSADDCNDNDVPDECEPDRDGDGLIDSCDGCPDDAEKTAPGLCGCGVSEADSDSDTVPDCFDVCPGADDRLDGNDNGIPDCTEPPIPALGDWGLVILTLLLLATAKIRFGRHARAGLSGR